jgi:hypothetical protein
LLLLCGCVHTIDRESACRIVHSDRSTIRSLPPHELAWLASGTPVQPRAESAWAQQIATRALGAVAIAAIVAGLVEGLSTDPATNEGARDAAYSLGGLAIGSVIGALVLNYTTRRTLDRARDELALWGERCP